MFTGEEEVRYWSVCLSNLEDTTTSEYCFADEQIVVDEEDGFVKLAIAPQDIVDEKPFSNWNYIPWADQERPVLLFRQLEPKEFEGSFNNVKTPSELNPEDFTPEEYERLKNPQSIEDIFFFTAHSDDNIGDYGPHGIYCSKEEFINNTCGY